MENNEVPEFILNVVFYKNENGTEPVRDWLRSLEKEDKQVIGEDIKTVQYGWPIGMPVVRKLEKVIWEIRTHLHGVIACTHTHTQESSLLFLVKRWFFCMASLRNHKKLL